MTFWTFNMQNILYSFRRLDMSWSAFPKILISCMAINISMKLWNQEIVSWQNDKCEHVGHDVEGMSAALIQRHCLLCWGPGRWHPECLLETSFTQMFFLLLSSPCLPEYSVCIWHHPFNLQLNPKFSKAGDHTPSTFIPYTYDSWRR